MSYRRWIAQCLTSAFEAGEFTEEQLIIRSEKSLGESPQWLPELVKDTVHQFSKKNRPYHHYQLFNFILEHTGFQLASSYPHAKIMIRYIYFETARPPSIDSSIIQFGLPFITTEGELIKWLKLSSNDLLWLKNTYRSDLQRQKSKAHHYAYHITMKRSGQPRLLEAPKTLLKHVQKQIYQEILKPLPQPAYVHGFVPGRSCISHAQLHIGQALVFKFDLQDFFPSIGFRKVYLQFLGLGYSQTIATTLTALCTHQTPNTKPYY